MNTDFAVVIGRFQILQQGHLALLRRRAGAGAECHRRDRLGLSRARCRTILSPGRSASSSSKPRSARGAARVSFLPVRDYYDEDRWNEAVRAGIAKIVGNASITPWDSRRITPRAI